MFFVSYLTIWLHIVIQINFRKHRRGNQKRTSRETGNIGYTRRRKIKPKHNTICVGHHYAQTNTNSVNKTYTLLQTTGGEDETNRHEQTIVNGLLYTIK